MCSYWSVPYASIELTPMIGGNDATSNIFTLANVATVTSYAISSGLGGLHYWSFDRDMDCPPGAASATCNSYGVAGPLGFANAFVAALGQPATASSPPPPPTSLSASPPPPQNNTALISVANGSGTWYYVTPAYTGPTCDGSSLASFISANDYAGGYPSCASYTPGPNQLDMVQLNSSNIIAIGQLFNGGAANRQLYCGKQVVVSYNGQVVSPPDGGSFYVWDGCEACATTYNFNNIDFALPGLGATVGSDAMACQQGKVARISFEVTNVQVKTFVP